MSHTLQPTRVRRLHRSALVVTGSDPGLIDRAAESAADVVVLDLEDAVTPPDKDQAREDVIAALNDIDWAGKGKTVSVRINGLDTEYCYRDLVDVLEHAGDRVHTLLVPKVGVPSDLYVVEVVSSQIERACGYDTQVGLEALIETDLGMVNVEAIAAHGGRLEALHLGLACGLNPDHPGDQWHVALSRMIVACRAYGLRAIDGPFGDFSDPNGYRDGARRAAALGAEGKWAIHPSQIELANEVFGTPADAIRAAGEG